MSSIGSAFQATNTASVPLQTPTASAARAEDIEHTGECRLLGPFAILVQAALGALALLSLVYKRWKERPQRPIKIWAFDVSKQVFGSVLLHLANLFMSMLSAGQAAGAIHRATLKAAEAGRDHYQPNPCSFYLLNLAIDTTLGIPILIIILRLLTAGAMLTPLANPPESLRSGYYGAPPRISWWLKQSVLYFVGLLGMKFFVFVIFQLLPWIIEVGDWALRWTEGNTTIQITFVMFIFPLIMNALQYYIIDSFIKSTPNAPRNEQQPAESREDGALLEDETQLILDLDQPPKEHRPNNEITDVQYLESTSKSDESAQEAIRDGAEPGSSGNQHARSLG